MSAKIRYVRPKTYVYEAWQVDLSATPQEIPSWILPQWRREAITYESNKPVGQQYGVAATSYAIPTAVGVVMALQGEWVLHEETGRLRVLTQDSLDYHYEFV